MSVHFNARHGIIAVPVRLWGRGGSGVLCCVLDTGSTNTSISAAALVTLGYDSSISSDRVEVTTASNVTFVPSVVIEKIRALDHERADFPVLSFTLPPSANVDGLLLTTALIMNHGVPWPLLGVAMFAPGFPCPRKAVGMAPIVRWLIINAGIK